MPSKKVEMSCPICGFMLSADSEEAVKDLLMKHSQDYHRMNKASFETMYSELMMARRLFMPSKT